MVPARNKLQVSFRKRAINYEALLRRATKYRKEEREREEKNEREAKGIREREKEQERKRERGHSTFTPIQGGEDA